MGSENIPNIEALDLGEALKKRKNQTTPGDRIINEMLKRGYEILEITFRTEKGDELFTHQFAVHSIQTSGQNNNITK